MKGLFNHWPSSVVLMIHVKSRVFESQCKSKQQSKKFKCKLQVQFESKILISHSSLPTKTQQFISMNLVKSGSHSVFFKKI